MKYIFRISGLEGKETFPIPLGETTIGREVDRDLVLPHPLVSRLHACLNCSEQDCLITDLKSANGTMVGEKLIAPNEPYPLQPGDKLMIGPYELCFEPAPPEEAELTLAEVPEVSNQTVEEEKEVSEPVVQPPVQEQEPPPPPPPPQEPIPIEPEPEPIPESPVPLGLTIKSQKLAAYLPGIYQTDFMERFLGLFESILLPIEWNVDNFDLFLDPGTAPTSFLPWLASWFEITFDDSWSEPQRRAFIKDAYQIFARRGTRWALARVLEIYTGCLPEIVDNDSSLEPHTFRVHFPFSETFRQRKLLEKIIDANKPAHTTYTIEFV